MKMNQLTRANSTLVTILSCALSMGLFVSCSSGPKVKLDPSTNPVEAINSTDSEINQGLANHYDILDQADFTKAQEKLDSAKSEQSKGDSQATVLKTLSYAQGYLKDAKNKADSLQSVSQGILDARSAALNAGVRKFPAEAKALKDADDDFRSEVDTLAAGKLSAKRWSELQAGYLNLELSTIQDAKLGNAKAKIEGAIKNDAKSNTPSILKTAEFDLRNAQNVIATDRHNEANMQPSVDKANASAQLLEDVLAQTKQPGGRISEAVATNLVMKNRRINKLDQQVAEKTNEVNSTSAKLSETNQELKGKEAALSLDQALQSASKELSPSEAEVYRQGNKLLIRLKAMNFATGRADLPADSMPLLAKVKDIAAGLKAQQIVVEGHTDSTGSPEKNLALSQNRAEAVANYFESNGIEKDKVEAIGYGFKKPLVSNKTKVGRATNRRVDILITPTQPQADGSHAQAM